MVTILREFLTRSSEGEEMWLCECVVRNDTTTMRNTAERTVHKDIYFRQRDGEMRALRAEQIEPGIFRLKNGVVVTEVK